MKRKVLFLLLVTCTKTSFAEDNIYAPSTSQQGSDQSRDLDTCILDRHAESILTLLTGEDLSSDHFENSVDERIPETELFASQVETMFRFATLGVNNFFDDISGPLQPDFQARLNYLTIRIVRRFIEIYYGTSSEPYREEITYRYNRENHTFSFTHNIRSVPRSLPSSENSTGSRQNGFTVFYQAPTFYLTNPRSDERKPFVVTHLGRTSEGVPLAKYYIIPRKLIVKFLKRWLSGYETNRPRSSSEFRKRVTMFHRLKQSLKKLMIYYIRKFFSISAENTVNYDYRLLLSNDNYFFQAVESFLTDSAGGNTFVGPSDRGPLDPTYETENNYRGALRAFDYDCEPIIGSERYNEMLNLFNNLLNYVENARRLEGLDRMTQGAELVITMVLTIERFRQTNYDESNWIQRILNSKELSKVPDNLKREFKTKIFSAIKRSEERSKRSLNNSERLYQTKTIFSIENYSKQQWSNFISDSIKNILKYRNTGKAVAWEHYLNRLYFHEWFPSLRNESESTDCDNQNFDSYLYLKISKIPAWQECNSFTRSNEPENWCSAWRRILRNYNINNDGKNVQRPIFYQEDMINFFSWLSAQITCDGENMKLMASETDLRVYKENMVCYKLRNAITFDTFDSSGYNEADSDTLTAFQKIPVNTYEVDESIIFTFLLENFLAEEGS